MTKKCLLGKTTLIQPCSVMPQKLLFHIGYASMYTSDRLNEFHLAVNHTDHPNARSIMKCHSFLARFKLQNVLYIKLKYNVHL